jgi:hypothetical protein
MDCTASGREMQGRRSGLIMIELMDFITMFGYKTEFVLFNVLLDKKGALAYYAPVLEVLVI